MASDKFDARSPEDVQGLVLAHPLAWVVSTGADRPPSTLLPIRPQFDAEGRITHLIGHFARSNPQVAHLRREPLASILFLGPHGYISPSWFADRTQAPTWNYASAEFRVKIEFLEDDAELEAILRDLVAAVESGRANAWTLEDMGERYSQLSRRIIAFRAPVQLERAKFKLGQDERDDVYADIRRGLIDAGREDLLAWMDRFNAERSTIESCQE